MKRNIAGFSLVELSIVLVILGLLTGGILTGQSLIRAAELRSVTTEAEQIATAVNTFKGKYFALPGDMNNAISFWTTAHTTAGTNCSAGYATAGTGTETCNGDGDGQIEPAPAAVQFGEKFMFWQHLANAGLINGTYSGMAGASNNYNHQIGTNAFQSKISGGTYFIESATNPSDRFNFVYINSLQFGARDTDGRPTAAIISTEEAWNIDTKVDDGQPGRGKLFSTRASCITGALTAPTAATYNLIATGSNCGLAWISPF